MLGRTIVASVGATAIDITGYDTLKGTVAPEPLAGSLPVGENDIALGRVTARKLGVDVGDDLTVVAASGEHTLRVSGITLVISIDGGEGLGHGGVVTADGLGRLDPGATFSSAVLQLEPDAPPDAPARLSESLGVEIGQASPATVLLNLDRIRSVPDVVAVIVSLLALLSLGHHLVVGARRRRHDVAILRSLGADAGQVAQLFHAEASTFAVAALVIAVPLGYVGGRLLFIALANRIGAREDVMLPLVVILTAATMLLFVVNAAAGLLARHARRQPLAPDLQRE